MTIERYFDDYLILTRFKTFEELKKKINEDLEEENLKVKDYDFKSDYDNDFEDYKLMMTIGNDEEDLYDLDIWYAVTRIGENIIVETSFEEVV